MNKQSQIDQDDNDDERTVRTEIAEDDASRLVSKSFRKSEAFRLRLKETSEKQQKQHYVAHKYNSNIVACCKKIINWWRACYLRSEVERLRSDNAQLSKHVAVLKTLVRNAQQDYENNRTYVARFLDPSELTRSAEPTKSVEPTNSVDPTKTSQDFCSRSKEMSEKWTVSKFDQQKSKLKIVAYCKKIMEQWSDESRNDNQSSGSSSVIRNLRDEVERLRSENAQLTKRSTFLQEKREKYNALSRDVLDDLHNKDKRADRLRRLDEKIAKIRADSFRHQEDNLIRLQEEEIERLKGEIRRQADAHIRILDKENERYIPFLDEGYERYNRFLDEKNERLIRLLDKENERVIGEIRNKADVIARFRRLKEEIERLRGEIRTLHQEKCESDE